MTINRSTVVATARGFLGTPFQHQGRTKGEACDCVGLPIMVGKELGLIEALGIVLPKTDYSRQPTNRIVHETCQRILNEKPVAEMKPGDILTLRMPTVPCHVAIVTDMGGYLGIIHSYAGGNYQVVEHILDDKWRGKIEGCFEIPGIVD